jgi:hypothetical protein
MRGVLATVLALALAACGARDAYHRKDGAWWFHSQRMDVPKGESLTALNGQFARSKTVAFYQYRQVPNADAPSFEALGDHYARDRRAVWFCATHRDSQDYFTTKRFDIFEVEGAHPASFQALSDADYGRDDAHVFYRGAIVPVKDPASFELLDGGFARDHVIGYYDRSPVAGSDGASFAALGEGYSRDKAQVFFSWRDHSQPGPGVPVSAPVRGAQLAGFTVLKQGYAADAAKAYYDGKPLPGSPAGLQVLDFGYAKTPSQVFYYGKPVPGADPATFQILETVTETATAQDKAATYQDLKRTPKPR